MGAMKRVDYTASCPTRMWRLVLSTRMSCAMTTRAGAHMRGRPAPSIATLLPPRPPRPPVRRSIRPCVGCSRGWHPAATPTESGVRVATEKGAGAPMAPPPRLRNYDSASQSSVRL